MKNIKYMIIGFFVLLLAKSHGQELNTVAAQVYKARESSKPFSNLSSILLPGALTPASMIQANVPEDASYFTYNAAIAKQLLDTHPGKISLEIPLDHGKISMLDLVEVPASFYDYTLRTSSGKIRYGNPKRGLHYRGVVRGREERSLVALSFFAGEIAGIISIGDIGNFNLGKVKNSSLHILYNDRDMKTPPSFNCYTLDDVSVTYDSNMPDRSNELLIDPYPLVNIYLETEFDIYQKWNDMDQVENYVTALFNELATLYQNEQIRIELSEMKIWDTADPYDATDINALLEEFQDETESINGDLGQLLTFRGIGGGKAAGFQGICNSDVDQRLAVSGGLSSSVVSVPTYSWNVEVITHEFGHLFGSRHTHACVWNGDNTAIDHCGSKWQHDNPDPDCKSNCIEGEACLDVENPILPSEGGTIMSYCHLQSVGINFNQGFGDQPGNVIRNSVQNGSCLRKLCTVDDLTVTSDVSDGHTDIQHTISRLSASNTIHSGGYADYRAGTYVVLSVGFHARAGSNLHVVIDDCDHPNGRDRLEVTTNQSKTREHDFVPSGLKLYPNPSHGMLNVSYPFAEAGVYAIRIYNMYGALVLHEEVTEVNYSLDVSKLEKGLYLVHFIEVLDGEEHVLTDKVVVGK